MVPNDERRPLVIQTSPHNSLNVKQNPQVPIHCQKKKSDTRHEDTKIYQFFLFICLSTAFRAFEAGIVSSMLPEISKDLRIGYVEQGMITASPDYGIAPGALLAMFTFSYFSSKTILLLVMMGSALACLLCVLSPSLLTLVLARAFGGLLWSHAATHYPVWINHKAPHSHKTLWLACTNVSLLVGTLTGYVVGGAMRTTTTTTTTTTTLDWTWVPLYLCAGLLMGLCGVLLWSEFDTDLIAIQSTTKEIRQNVGEEESEFGSDSFLSSSSSQVSLTLWQVLTSLMNSIPFLLSVAITGCLSGGVVFALYFIAQVCEARQMDPSVAVWLVTVVFVSAPAPGLVFGSWLVSRLGGYIDHVVTFGVSFVSGLLVLGASFLFPISWRVWGAWPAPFVLACWIFFFAGAMAGPPLNGVAVSVVPQASHIASALQFAFANASKIVVPQIGGYLCSRLGLLEGFNMTIIMTSLVFVVCAWLGLTHATQCRRDLARNDYDSIPN